MADETFYKGAIRILHIKVSSVWFPVACLTSNPFSEEVDMMETAESTAEGWATSLPTNQRYNIDFNGLQLLTTGLGDLTKMSYDRLKALKRTRTRIEWKIDDNLGLYVDSGFGYIDTISEGNEVGSFLEFSGSITGFGEPVFVSGAVGAYLFQDGNAFVFQDGNSFIFQ